MPKYYTERYVTSFRYLKLKSEVLTKKIVTVERIELSVERFMEIVKIKIISKVSH